MFFRLPNPPLASEIPDDWLEEAGAVGFVPTRSTYRNGHTAVEAEVLVPLVEVAPMLRTPTVALHHHGFRRQGGFGSVRMGGMVDVLKAIVGGVHLPPIQVRAIRGASREGFRYAVQDGFHRYDSSCAMSFTRIPCLADDDWRSEGQFGDA